MVMVAVLPVIPKYPDGFVDTPEDVSPKTTFVPGSVVTVMTVFCPLTAGTVAMSDEIVLAVADRGSNTRSVTQRSSARI
jgi:hypothetical protein